MRALAARCCTARVCVECGGVSRRQAGRFKKSHGHVLYTPQVASISEAWIDKKSRESARTRFQFH